MKAMRGLLLAGQRRALTEAAPAAAGPGRYGRATGNTETYYNPEDIQGDSLQGLGKSRRPFNLGLTTRALINRNRQRLGLPVVYNWKKFTSEAVKVREELCGLDDPRAQQQLERERKAKSGSTWEGNKQNFNNRRKPFSKYAQSSAENRPAPHKNPLQHLMHIKQHADAMAVARVVNDANRQSVAEAIKALGKPMPKPESIKYVPRMPVVAVMGHVDHGKTTLLDTLRNANVAAGEAGGITQSVGAFRVAVPGRDIPVTFIDTPGHAAFDNMRQASVNATDIVVLVLSVVEGIQPQTVQVIDHIKRMDVPCVVAFNKIDMVEDYEAAIIRHTNDLAGHGLMLESMDGDVLSAAISARKGVGINDLLEALLLQAELLELTTPVPCRSEALVIESKAEPSAQQPGLNPVVSKGTNVVNAIVKRGTFRPGMTVVSGEFYTKITAVLDEGGNPIKEALPGQPVSLVGFGTSAPGPTSIIVDAGRRVSQKEWKKFYEEFTHAKLKNAEWLDAVQKEQRLLFWVPRHDIPDEALPHAQRRDDTPHLRLILKANTQGMVDAMESAVEQLQKVDRVIPRVIYKGVGDINDNDSQLFNQRADVSLVIGVGVENNCLAEFEKAPILIDVIYDMLQAIKERMLEFYPPRVVDNETGRAVVKDTFKFSGEKVGNVGGLHVSSGKLQFQGLVKVLRGGVEVYRSDSHGCIKSLRHVKNEVQVVEQGMECGLILKDGFSFEVGDEIVQFKTEEVPIPMEEVFTDDA